MAAGTFEAKEPTAAEHALQLTLQAMSRSKEQPRVEHATEFYDAAYKSILKTLQGK